MPIIAGIALPIMELNAWGVIAIPSRKEWAYVREKMYRAIEKIINKTSTIKTIMFRLPYLLFITRAL